MRKRAVTFASNAQRGCRGGLGPGRSFPETGDRQGPLRALAAVQRQYAELPLPAELAALERINGNAAVLAEPAAGFSAWAIPIS